jgi:hypothetical protein
MNTPRTLLFKTVPERDYLQFWQNDAFEPQRVVRFLELTKSDVAKVANVAAASVRFDQKIPKDVLDRFLEIANVCGLVAQFFNGDVIKTGLWFRTKNPLLGNLSPRDMIRYGRYEKLRRFVMEALEENAAVTHSSGAQELNRGASPATAQ